jgi:hypothetical protein
MVARDGGVFAYGDARFYGSLASQHLDNPVTGLYVTVDGGGYSIVNAAGTATVFGDAK